MQPEKKKRIKINFELTPYQEKINKNGFPIRSRIHFISYLYYFPTYTFCRSFSIVFMLLFYLSSVLLSLLSPCLRQNGKF